DARVHRGQRMVEALNRLGVPVRWERVRELAQGSVGRPHVAQALVETGHVRSLGEAFDIYIGHGRPAYVPRPRFTAVEAIQFVRAHGGVVRIVDGGTGATIEVELPSSSSDQTPGFSRT
ncbi:MAG: hypothetical protein K1X38_16560, partial [Microthrixaceae bacterium]|nr:hypothetical protein [Microthrixaceae bacterium]